MSTQNQTGNSGSRNQTPKKPVTKEYVKTALERDLKTAQAAVAFVLSSPTALDALVEFALLKEKERAEQLESKLETK